MHNSRLSLLSNIESIMNTGCQCDNSGCCEYLGRKMNKHRFKECSTSQAHHDLFARESKAGKYKENPIYHCGKSIEYVAAVPSEKQEGVGEENLLGDIVESALSSVGITKERVSSWLGEECGCEERKNKLNKLHKWAKDFIGGKKPDAPFEE